MTPVVEVLILGGTGFYQLERLTNLQEVTLQTPFGPPSSPLQVGNWGSLTVGFIARHGVSHQWLPHQVNYRANLFAARLTEARALITINTVGSLNRQFEPGQLVLPDQIIDYTWGREHTFADQLDLPDRHVDLTQPFDRGLREALVAVGEPDLLAGSQATYGATQGPRLETAAEIRRLGRDGCDLVGMTGMPEAGLARELDLAMASVAVVANWAAGFTDEAPIEMAAITANVARGSALVQRLLDRWIDSQGE